LMLHKHKNLVVDQIAHYNVFKNSNFTDRSVVLVVVRRCPSWWPTLKTIFALHQRMMAELHFAGPPQVLGSGFGPAAPQLSSDG
jgi:hypothetical protein